MSTNDDYDSLWKDIIELYFPEFMAFFFAKAHDDIDWSRGYEIMDTELQQIVRDAESGKRLADELWFFGIYHGYSQRNFIFPSIFVFSYQFACML